MNMQAIMKQAQALQKDMMKAKDEISQMEFEGKSNLIRVIVDGNKKIKTVEIQDKDQFQLDDLELLEDMIMVALNQAFEEVDKTTEQKLGKFSNGMPGLF